MRRMLFVLAAVLLCTAGCGGDSAAGGGGGGGGPRVVATVGMLGDVVARVAGERVEVVTLLPPGSDPHTYQPTTSDVRTLRDAEAVVYVGLRLEGRLGDVLARREGPTLAAGEAVPVEMRLAYGDGPATAGEFDPHLWMDPGRWALVIDPVVEVLTQVDPAGAAEFEANAAALRAELALLDEYVADAVASVPPRARVLVTAHDAFSYFGEAYGVEEIGIQGISTEAEASNARIREIVDLVAERGVPAIFVESSVSEKNVAAIREGALADHGHAVEVGGELYSDAMGPAGSGADSYVGMIDHNATTIANALGGRAEGFARWRAGRPAAGESSGQPPTTREAE